MNLSLNNIIKKLRISSIFLPYMKENTSKWHLMSILIISMLWLRTSVTSTKKHKSGMNFFYIFVQSLWVTSRCVEMIAVLSCITTQMNLACHAILLYFTFASWHLTYCFICIRTMEMPKIVLVAFPVFHFWGKAQSTGFEGLPLFIDTAFPPYSKDFDSISLNLQTIPRTRKDTHSSCWSFVL